MPGNRKPLNMFVGEGLFLLPGIYGLMSADLLKALEKIKDDEWSCLYLLAGFLDYIKK
ncbi:MAG: hypothetical protein H6Q67_2031 [Firmicutes bacterium]|nr:hypothetical protein [Bacillota bacterium]